MVWAAAALLVLEALALLGLAVFELYGAAFDHPATVAGALWGSVLCLAGTFALGAGARGLVQLRPAARTPMVVIQIVSLPVGYTIGFQAGRLDVGGPMLVIALAVIYLLFTPPARAALNRDHTF